VNVVAAFDARTTLGATAHALSALAAGILTLFSLRSKVTFHEGTLTSLGVLRDKSAVVHRIREVKSSTVGPLEVWAPQADTGESGGWVIAQCAILRSRTQPSHQIKVQEGTRSDLPD
jgi:hypothetical protein